MDYLAGIYYTYDKPIHNQPGIQDKGFWSWTQAHLLLSRFPLSSRGGGRSTASSIIQ